MPDLDAAERFVATHARLLERHRFAYLFRDGPAEPVLAALAAYETGDGGYGHALEPDLRGPDAQPGALETALRVLDEVGALDGARGRRALAWLAGIAPDGGLPFMLPSGLVHPRAPWWQTEPDPPGSLIMTGLVAGDLLRAGIRDPWLDRASSWCWTRLAAIGELSPYEARGALSFLDGVPETERAEAALERIAPLVAPLVALDPQQPGEKHTPLDLSPHPGSRSRALFEPSVVDAHLDWLAAAQEDDGGWSFDWAAWCPAATLEWRGVMTVHALATLRAHGRPIDRP